MPFRKSKVWGSVSPPVGVGINFNASLVSGLIAAVPLNEGAGQTVTNYKGAQKLTGTGTPTWTSGRGGPSLNLSFASSQYVSDNTNSNIVLPTTTLGFSASFWTFLPANLPSGVGNFFTVGNNASVRCTCDFFSNDIRFDFPTDVNGRVQATISGFFGRWVHVGMTSNGINSRAIYFNGALSASTSTTTSQLGTQLTGLWIGSWPIQNQYLTGRMTNFKAWNRMLSATEVQSDYGDPYSIYVMPRRRIISQVAAAAGISFNRKTLSGIGGRIGSRQTHG